MPKPVIAPPDDPRSIAMREVFDRLDNDPEIDKREAYSICCQVAGQFVARYVAGDPNPAIRSALGLIANAMQETLRVNPEMARMKQVADQVAAMPVKGGTN